MFVSHLLISNNTNLLKKKKMKMYYDGRNISTLIWLTYLTTPNKCFWNKASNKVIYSCFMVIDMFYILWNILKLMLSCFLFVCTLLYYCSTIMFGIRNKHQILISKCNLLCKTATKFLQNNKKIINLGNFFYKVWNTETLNKNGRYMNRMKQI